jgi:hypothetical protein
MMARRLPFVRACKIASPDFRLKTLRHPKGFDMTLVDESHLFGGSKQRALIRMIPGIDQRELVYAGPSTGYAQVALAYCCMLTGKKATVFTDMSPGELVNGGSDEVDGGGIVGASLVRIAQQLGANVIFFNPKERIDTKRLPYIQKQAEHYVTQEPSRRHLLPFGLKNDEAMKLYLEAFAPLKAIISSPKRIWVVGGSAMIANTLGHTFPEAKIMIIQVGKTIWPDQLEGINHQLFISPLAFRDDIKEVPPYDTLLNYDGKLWPFVLEHGEPGDYVWNTAGAARAPDAVAKEIADINMLLDESAQEELALLESTTDMRLPMFHSGMPKPADMFATIRAEARAMPITDPIVNRNFSDDYMRADGLSNHFTEAQRMKCIVNRSARINMYSYWDRRRGDIVHEAYWMMGEAELVARRPTVMTWRDAMGAAKCYECNTFNPLIMANTIRRYFGDRRVRVLDPSMGWGDRLIAALAMEVELYVGFDPNTDLTDAYKHIHDTLAPEANVLLIPDKYSNARMPADMVRTFDLALTSPPFYDQELYKHSEDDVKCSYTQWLRDMYEPYMRDMARAVRPGGFVAVYIDNVPRVAPMADDTNRILKEAGLVFVERINFQNDYRTINGVVRPGHPRPLWIYKVPEAQATGGTGATTLADEWARTLTTKKLIATATKFAKAYAPATSSLANVAYEVSNVVERLLLTLANRAALDASAVDPVLNRNPDLGEYAKDITYKFPGIPKDRLAEHLGAIKLAINGFADRTSAIEMPTWSITYDGDIATFKCGDYSRSIAAVRMRMLIERASEEAVVKMLLRYASIISGSNHWQAPIEYFRILYDLGCRFEGFSSPINSNLILPEFNRGLVPARICTLFPDVDAPWGSIGGFFQTDFLGYWTPEFTPIVVVGPPYFDELILHIAQHVIDHCKRAAREKKSIRFIITHSNSWDYSEGFRLLRESPFKRLDHVFKKREHYYETDQGKRITAMFETRLFVLDAGLNKLTMDERQALINLFPRANAPSRRAQH